jgi:hypothetical protein
MIREERWIHAPPMALNGQNAQRPDHHAGRFMPDRPRWRSTENTTKTSLNM